MEIVWRRGSVTVKDVLEGMSDPPSYSAVRAMVGLLEGKGHLRHCRRGRAYVYEPVVSSVRARRSALQNLLRTFFNDSAEQVVASLLELRRDELTDKDIARLRALIDGAGRTEESRKEEEGT
jgi:predicted transcriptional regulator